MSTNYIPLKDTTIKFSDVCEWCKDVEDGVQLFSQPREASEGDPKPVADSAGFSPENRYIISDGTNWLHLNFNNTGVLESADRYGANNVEDLLDFLGGNFVSEHDDEYWDIQGDEDGGEEDTNESTGSSRRSKVRQLVDSLLK